jgi:hypothetical protein
MSIPHRRSSIPIGIGALLLVSVIGCSQETTHGVVNGTVTLDGAPLPSGLIRFIPEDGQSATADAQIKDGKYQATVPVGGKRITLSAPKIVGKRKVYETPDSPTVDVVEELLPAEYNVSSSIKLNVVPGDQSKDFELKSTQ